MDELGKELIDHWGLPNTTHSLMVDIVAGETPIVTCEFYVHHDVGEISEIFRKYEVKLKNSYTLKPRDLYTTMGYLYDHPYPALYAWAKRKTENK